MGEVSIDSRAALGLRRSTMAIRIVMMGLVAALLYFVAHWAWAPFWGGAYAVLQAAILTIDLRMGGRGFWPIHGLYFFSFSLAGAPTWHLWTEVPGAGPPAAVMFLCGMFAQQAASSFAARSLFLCSAAPLAAYLLIVPPLALGPGLYSAAIVASALLFLIYLAIVWSGQQRVLALFQRSRSEAQAASRAKSLFLASVGHEIRTPMNAILSVGALLARSDLTPEQREQVGMLQSGGAMLMQLLDDLLDLSKIEAGKLTIEPSPVDLAAVVRGCVVFWRPSAADAGLALEVEIAPETPRYVSIDPVRTAQILGNLLANAVKFTERGSIRVEVATEPAAEGEGWLVLRVSDTGIGMTSEALGRLFAPFEQADRSITRRFGGTGLGLAISRKLAELMGGELTARSEAGVGSTFTLRLPARVADRTGPAPVESAAEARRPHQPFRVLLAEDHAANQRIIELFLRPMSVELVIVDDGLQAVEALAGREFDVVLMDVQMPVVDGLEATRRVRASGGANAQIPILALTANVLPEQQAACAAAGMSGHIEKPVDARLLMTAVANAGIAARTRRQALGAAPD